MMNEAETRADYIDIALRAAGWGVVENSRIRHEYPITLGRLEGAGKRGKSLSADYVLQYRNTYLAVIEAKAWNKSVSEGVAQAKNYAGKLEIRFTYSTNGQGIYAIDMDTGKEGELSNYPTPQELWNATFSIQNAWRDRFAFVPFEDRGGYFKARYYQDIAIEKVLEAIGNGQSRILLTLATGTGKTFIAFQLAWKLFKSRWNLTDWQSENEPTRQPRILFLADRNILANQAYNAFSAFPDDALVRIEPSEISKKGRVPKNGSLFFTIFQSFMSGEEPYFGQYPTDFFDIIIIDECHRGGANDEGNWRGILEYFKPAVQLGLTATPKRKDNVDTYAYFGEPVFIYSLKDGVNDGFLTPFRIKQVASTLDNYVYSADDTVVEGEIVAGKTYGEADFNKIIIIPEREKLRVELFMSQINQQEKTLVFCATQEHALLVRDLINQTKTSTNPNYCHRVTADDGALGEQYLADFQDNEKTIPTILTTSQKLSTGVDARNIRNIVLMRPVNSMIEFKQIIGRGTRLYDGKDYFSVYDFVGAHHHFEDKEWDGEPEQSEPIESKPKLLSTEPREPPTRTKIRVILADGKARNIQHTTVTSFWSEPSTRQKLLEGLAEKGFGHAQLLEMQKIIEAENSDLFDVLAHVAYALPTLTREERATKAKVIISTHFNSKQQVFLDFVLSHYVSIGVEELEGGKLSQLLRLKYHDSIADAIADLGKPADISDVFNGFQKYLYERKVA